MGLFDWFKKKVNKDISRQSDASTFDVKADGSKIITTKISHKNSNGWIIRGYNADRKEYQMIDSYFDDELSRWIEDVKIPLVEGKGIPTILYSDLRAMKALGIKLGELDTFIIYNVHDWESVFHLAWLIKQYPQEKVSTLFTHTRLFKSRENVIVQSGHKIVNIEIDLTGAIFNHPHHLPESNFTKEKLKKLCSKYEIDQQEMVLWKFNVIMKVLVDIV